MRRTRFVPSPWQIFNAIFTAFSSLQYCNAVIVLVCQNLSKCQNSVRKYTRRQFCMFSGRQNKKWNRVFHRTKLITHVKMASTGLANGHYTKANSSLQTKQNFRNRERKSKMIYHLVDSTRVCSWWSAQYFKTKGVAFKIQKRNR